MSPSLSVCVCVIVYVFLLTIDRERMREQWERGEGRGGGGGEGQGEGGEGAVSYIIIHHHVQQSGESLRGWERERGLPSLLTMTRMRVAEEYEWRGAVSFLHSLMRVSLPVPMGVFVYVFV